MLFRCVLPSLLLFGTSSFTFKHSVTRSGSGTFQLGGTDLPWTERYRYIGINQSPKAANGDVGLKGRINAARAAANRLLRALTERSVHRAFRMNLYLRHIALVLDYGSEALPLSETQLYDLDGEEAEIMVFLECIPSPYESFSTRWQKRRLRFLTKLRKAPEETWRRRMVNLMDKNEREEKQTNSETVGTQWRRSKRGRDT
eukprot:Lithocolla_globosa_v1_NODE_1753_length_2361_cov_15.383781.p1 type:complete len:201 gc:universal NODE_1753_length_2361_cov_15.383781:1112-510(-)